ncbi:MAG: TIM barrel protein [Acidobacteriota bacterium]
MTLSRRGFMFGTTAMAALAAAGRSQAAPLRLPLGIQLYSVREQMAADFEGTLGAVHDAGYTEVEAAALPKRTASEVRKALDGAGLACVSAHHPFGDLRNRFDQIVEFDRAIGARWIICATPGRRVALPAGATNPPPPPSLDDWHYNADQFNAMGEKLKAAGMRFGYHNHTGEFAPVDGKVPYMELLRLCDPDKVAFELDCGWAKVAGIDPVAMMREYPHRFRMLHIKDFRLAAHPNPTSREGSEVVELGRGNIDYAPILAQASHSQSIEHMFVEQEAFTVPWKESIAIDAAYLKRLEKH